MAQTNLLLVGEPGDWCRACAPWWCCRPATSPSRCFPIPRLFPPVPWIFLEGWSRGPAGVVRGVVPWFHGALRGRM